MLVANSPAAAKANTDRWNAANAANPPKSVFIPNGTVYINGVIKTRPIVGCGRINTDGSFGTSVDGNPGLTGALARVVQLGKCACLRLSGNGFFMSDPIEFVGDGQSTAIEIEGRTTIPTGRHRFANIIFSNWGCAFDAMPGYYDGDVFKQDENHADNCIVSGCETFNVGTLFRSRNQQAVQWAFNDCVVNELNGPKEQIVADIQRGGNITLTNLMINHPRATIFRVKDFSPNNCNLTCRDFRLDRVPVDDFRLTLFEFVGDAVNAYGYHWVLEMNGFASTYHTKFNREVLYRVPANLPKDKWLVRFVEGS